MPLKEEIDGNSSTHRSLLKSLFIAMSMIIETNIINIFIYIPLVIIEIIQMISLVLNSSQFDQAIQFYLSISTIQFFFIKNIPDSIIIVWVISAIILILFFFFMTLVVLIIHFSNKKIGPLFKIFIRIIGLGIIIMKSIFIIPFASILSTMIFCGYGCSKCWNNEYIAFAIISIFLFIFFIIFAYIFESLNDSYFLSKLPWSTSISSSGYTIQILKFILPIYFNLDHSQYLIELFICFILIILIFHIHSLIFHTVCYNKGVELLYYIRGIVPFYLGLVYLCYIVLNWEIDNFMIFIHILVGLFFSIVFVIYEFYSTKKCFEDGIKYPQKKVKSVKIFFILLQYILKFSQNPQNYSFVKGFINLHRENCKNLNCPSKTNKILYANFAKINISSSKGHETNQSIDEHNKMSSIINNDNEVDSFIIKESLIPLSLMDFMEIKKALDEFCIYLIHSFLEETKPSIDLIIVACSYYDAFAQNYLKGIFLLLSLPQQNYSFQKRFQRFFILSLLDRKYYESELENNKRFFEVKIDEFLSFEKGRRNFMNSMKNSIYQIIGFWKNFLNLNPNIEQFFDSGGKISEYLIKVSKNYNRIYQICSDHLNTNLVYGNFLVNVIGNYIEGFDLINKVNAKIESLDKYTKDSITEEKLYSLNSQTSIIITSGLAENIGQIVQVNDYTKNIFGYEMNELIGYPSNKLMTKNIALIHDKFYKHFINTGSFSSIANTVFTFGLHKQGYILPIIVMIKIVNGITDGLKFIAFIGDNLKFIKKHYIKVPFKFMKNDMFFILTDSYGTIISVCKKMLDLLGIPEYYLNRKKMLSNEPLNIIKISSKLNLEENVKELLQGNIIEINPSKIINKLDQDYLNEDDRLQLSKIAGTFACHVILLQHCFLFNLRMNIFCFTILEDKEKDINYQNEQKFIHKIDNIKLQIPSQNDSNFKIDPRQEGISIIKNIKEIKNLYQNQAQPKFLWFYGKIAALFLIAFLVLEIIAALVELNKITEINNKEHLLKYSKLRLYNFFNLEIFLPPHIWMLIGYFAKSVPISPNRSIIVKNFLQKIAYQSSIDEFNFEKYLNLINITDISKIYFGSGIKYQEISSTGQVSYLNNLPFMTLSHLSYSKTLRIISESTADNINSDFSINIFNPEYSTTDPLSLLDQYAYYVIINVYYNFIPVSSNFCLKIIDSIFSSVNEYFNLAVIYFFIPKIFVILCFFASIIPIVKIVHKSKSNLLNIFAETPNLPFTNLYKSSLQFSHSIEFMKNPDFSSGNLEDIQKKGESLHGNTDISAVNTAKELLNNVKKGNVQNAEEAENNEDNPLSCEEGFLMKERKRLFEYYFESRKLLISFFLFFLLIFLILQIVYISLIINLKKVISDNNNFINALYYRIYYLSMITITYYGTSVDHITLNSTKGYLFDEYYYEALKAEDNMTAVVNSFPDNQKSVIDQINELNEGNFCTNILKYSHISLAIDSFSKDLCLQFPNKILDKGLSFSIVFFLKHLRYKFYTDYIKKITNIYDSYFTPSRIMVNQIVIFILQYLELYSTDNFISVLISITSTIYVMFTIFIVYALVLFLFFIYFFLTLLEKEYIQIRGLYTLFPVEILTQNELLYEKFKKEIEFIQ